MTKEDLKDFLQKREWRFTEKGESLTVVAGTEEVRITYPERAPCIRILIPESWREEVEKVYDFPKAGNEYLLDKNSENLVPFLQLLVHSAASPAAGIAPAEKEQQKKPAPLNQDQTKRSSGRSNHSVTPSAAKITKAEEWQRKKAALLKLDKTERISKISSRIGQDLLRDLLLEKYHHCMIIPEIISPSLLVASHIKPWKECDDDPAERLNENNCLLLSTALDKLFDGHLISFSAEDGHMLISPCIDLEQLAKLGVVPSMRLADEFRAGRESFLKSHNEKLQTKTAE